MGQDEGEAVVLDMGSGYEHQGYRSRGGCRLLRKKRRANEAMKANA